MPGKRKDLPEGELWSYVGSMEAHWNAGFEELENEPNKVQCLPCHAHVFGASTLQRKAVKKHIESKVYQCAIRTAAETQERETVTRLKVHGIDIQAFEAEAHQFVSPLSGELPAKCPPVSQAVVGDGETLREKEMWERFETEGFEQPALPHTNDCDSGDGDELLDAALRRRHETFNPAAVGLTESSSFCNNGGKTTTTIPQNIGKAFACNNQCRAH